MTQVEPVKSPEETGQQVLEQGAVQTTQKYALPHVSTVQIRSDGRLVEVDGAVRAKRRARGEDEDSPEDFLCVTTPGRQPRIYASRFAPYEVALKTRRLDAPMLLHGRLVSEYEAPCVMSYVDLTSGEILPAKELGHEPECTPIRAAEMLHQRAAVLDSLHPEVRRFADYVLLFRNHRRGVTPNLDELVEWYAELHGRRPADVRRLVPRLQAAKICDAKGDVLFPLFQKTSKRMRRSHYLGEYAFAGIRQTLLLRKRDLAILDDYLLGGPDRSRTLGSTAPTLPKSWAMLAKDPQFLTELKRKYLGSGMMVPLEHLQGTVPCDSRQLNDVRQLRRQSGGGRVSKVVKPKIWDFRALTQSPKHSIESAYFDWEDMLAAAEREVGKYAHCAL